MKVGIKCCSVQQSTLSYRWAIHWRWTWMPMMWAVERRGWEGVSKFCPSLLSSWFFFLLLFPCVPTTKPIIMEIFSVKAFCFVPKISEWGYCLLYSLLGERLRKSACIFFFYPVHSGFNIEQSTIQWRVLYINSPSFLKILREYSYVLLL